MKTRTTSSVLGTLILALLTLGAMQAQAIVINWRPVGITLGQTARVTAANTGTTTVTITGMTFLDSEGTVLAQFARQVIEPGKMMSFDLNADDLIRESSRLEIRIVLSADTSKGLVRSTEVFENDTGKTTVFYGDPDQ
jgi:hypothetical protein